VQGREHDEKQPSPRSRDEQLGSLERGGRRHAGSHLVSRGSALKNL